jgi:hypothetical protein
LSGKAIFISVNSILLSLEINSSQNGEPYDHMHTWLSKINLLVGCQRLAINFESNDLSTPPNMDNAFSLYISETKHFNVFYYFLGNTELKQYSFSVWIKQSNNEIVSINYNLDYFYL